MMKLSRRLVTNALLPAVLVMAATSARAQTCEPGISAAFVAHQPSYTELAVVIAPALASLQAELAAVVDQPTYETLLNHANTLAGNATLTSGRVVITLPDGTAILDTSRDDNTADPKSNSFAHFQAKSINENHNSPVAIFTAQEYPCGVAVETKTSTSTGQVENYIAFRLGTHLDSVGTARISQIP